MSKLIPEESYVWCHTHGTVHEATTDPYDYGEPDCAQKDHRKVYWRTRKGDWENEEVEA